MSTIVIRGDCQIRFPSATDLPALDLNFGGVDILHPFNNLRLFSLPCFDREVATGNFGVERRIIDDACHIITNNRAGYLSEDRAGEQRLSTTIAIVPAGSYYLHLNDSQVANYPIVSEFSAWLFPGLPKHWCRLDAASRIQRRIKYCMPPSTMSTKVKAIDGSCMITGFPTCEHFTFY